MSKSLFFFLNTFLTVLEWKSQCILDSLSVVRESYGAEGARQHQLNLIRFKPF